MTWIEILTLGLAGFAGFLLGGIFFGGLWWTVRNGMTSERPGLWFLGSMIVRMTIVMAGFYFVGGGQWERLLSCLFGFIAARSIVVRWTRLTYPKHLIRSIVLEAYSEPVVRLRKESHHAT